MSEKKAYKYSPCGERNRAGCIYFAVYSGLMQAAQNLLVVFRAVRECTGGAVLDALAVCLEIGGRAGAMRQRIERAEAEKAVDLFKPLMTGIIPAGGIAEECVRMLGHIVLPISD